MLEIRRSRDRPTFSMKIPILVRHIYIETAHGRSLVGVNIIPTRHKDFILSDEILTGFHENMTKYLAEIRPLTSP